jgi:nucleoid DNA-binding protein
MTYDEFLRKVAHNADITIQDTELFMNALIKSFEECVRDRESFNIVNVGVLDFAKVKARSVHSKLLGDNNFPETEKIYFRISQNLKKILKSTKK